MAQKRLLNCGTIFGESGVAFDLEDGGAIRSKSNATNKASSRREARESRNRTYTTAYAEGEGIGPGSVVFVR